MSFRRIIFIDFDGVTHPAAAPAAATLPFEWVPLLARLIAEAPDVGVVVHSSWREQFSEDYLRDFLEPVAGQFAGAAPPGRKAAAIAEFLHTHPAIESAMVLEDDPDEVEGITGVDVLLCDPARGISCPEAQRQLRAWLARSSPSTSRRG